MLLKGVDHWQDFLINIIKKSICIYTRHQLYTNLYPIIVYWLFSFCKSLYFYRSNYAYNRRARAMVKTFRWWSLLLLLVVDSESQVAQRNYHDHFDIVIHRIFWISFWRQFFVLVPSDGTEGNMERNDDRQTMNSVIGRYSRPSYPGAMGTMSKKTEWNGIISFLNILKSEWKNSKGLHDLAATRSCTRVLLLRVQNIGTARLRVWAGSSEVGKSPKVRKSESPDPGPTGLGNRKIGKTEIT